LNDFETPENLVSAQTTKDTNFKIQPLGTRILVRRHKRNETEGGILLPDVSKDSSLIGEVIAVGDECRYIKQGAMIFFGVYSGREVKVLEPGYDDVILMNEEDVLGFAIPEEEYDRV
jgi:chaperonin GroES